MISKLSDLRIDVVLSSRSVEIDGRRLNQGFAWTRDAGYQGSRSKVYGREAVAPTPPRRPIRGAEAL